MTADAAVVMGYGCESENVNENCRSLSGCVCCCNCENNRWEKWT